MRKVNTRSYTLHEKRRCQRNYTHKKFSFAIEMTLISSTVGTVYDYANRLIKRIFPNNTPTGIQTINNHLFRVNYYFIIPDGFCTLDFKKKVVEKRTETRHFTVAVSRTLNDIRMG